MLTKEGCAKMQMKKVYIALLALVVLLFSAALPVRVEASGNISITVDNKLFLQGINAETIDSTLMVPAKELAQALGGNFTYNSTSMSGTIRVNENEITFYLEEKTAKLNGKYLPAEMPLRIFNARFMVPAEFTARKLGYACFFNSDRNALLLFRPVGGRITYQVVSGDSLWLLSRWFKTTIPELKRMNGLTGDMLYVGQKLVVGENITAVSPMAAYTTGGATLWIEPGFEKPVVGYLQAWTDITITGKQGEWYKASTPKGNGYLYSSVVGMKQELSFNGMGNGAFFSGKIPVDLSGNTLTYQNYSVQRGDSLWAIGQKFSLPDYELAAANSLSTASVLYIGQVLKIPVHHVAIKPTPGAAYGEILDWYEEGQYVFPIGKTAKLTDMESGKSFYVQRTIGSSHADVETLTMRDTAMMKEIFQGTWSWNRKAMILEVDGRRIAVSISGMPHAGVDGVPFLKEVNGRSDGWGYGPNYDAISGNGMDGHFDMYFLNSLRHKDNQLDASHQYNILMAGGLQ